MELTALQFPTTEKAEQTQPRWKGILWTVVFTLLSAVCGYFLASLVDIAPPDNVTFVLWEEILLFTAVLLAAFFAIVLHELGHLLGGKLGGFRFALLVVGPLRLTRNDHGWHLGWNGSLSMAGGLAGSLPTPTSNLRRGLLLMIAGGPLTSLLLGGAALTVTLAMEPVVKTAVVLHLLLLAFGATSLFIGLVTLLPLTTGGFKSDGKRLLELLRRHPEAVQTNLVVLVSAAAMAGQRPRDWNPAHLAELAALQAPSAITAAAASLLYSQALDNGDLAAAQQQLQRMLDLNHLLPAPVQNEALFEAAFFEAWYRQDVAQALRFLPQTNRDGLGEAATRLKAQTAVALRQQKWPEAQSQLAAAYKAITRTMSPGTAVLTRTQLDAMASAMPQ
ncbi:MAG: hypothetical protein R3D55_12850 [Chloroflexota bacterium]